MAQVPISGHDRKEFKSDEDVFEIIKLLIEEAEEWNLKGKEFDVAASVTKQLPFFCCQNSVLRTEFEKDIQRYIYCTETGINPYSGAYGDQPQRWIEKFFYLKTAFAQKSKIKAEKNGTRKNNN